VSEVNRNAPLEIEDATPADAALDITNSAALSITAPLFGGIKRENSENTP
jgi:hypothetical protein